MQRESGTIHRSGAIGVTAVLDTSSGTATARSGIADPRTGQAATDNLSSMRPAVYDLDRITDGVVRQWRLVR